MFCRGLVFSCLGALHALASSGSQVVLERVTESIFGPGVKRVCSISEAQINSPKKLEYVYGLIQKSATAKMQIFHQKNALLTRYSGFLPESNHPIILLESGTVSETSRRLSSEADALVLMLDRHCGF